MQVEHLANKGIAFCLMNREEAIAYLRSNNNFFKIYSYRKNFAKDVKQERYLFLDFAYLVDLAIIDMYLRFMILKLSLNIEHFAKVKLLRYITDSEREDGYSIVSDYLASLPDAPRTHLDQELSRNAESPYCADVYEKYKDCLPAWAFVEIIPFGSFLSFYKFCAERITIDCPKEHSVLLDDFYLMLSVKRIRNAAAHNSCIINDLRAKSNPIRANYRLTRALRELGIGSRSTQKKLSNLRIMQILNCLYTHKMIVPSAGVQHCIACEMHDFSRRLFSHYLYDDNLLIKSSFDLLSTAIDKWYPMR